MTPKEKSIELFDKYFNEMRMPSDCEGCMQCVDRCENMVVVAKRYSLMTVDEIIKSREEDGSFDDTLSSTSSEYYTPHPMYLTYWQQVKQEIEKL